MKPNEKRQGGRQGGCQGGGQGWGSGGYGAAPPKMPDNPMEAMGMAMAMMNTWMTPDADADKRKSGGRGGQKQGGYSHAGNSYAGNSYAANPSWNTGFQGGFGGGYGNGASW